MSSTMKVRVGLLGVSHPHFESRAGVLAREEGVEIAAAHDPDPELLRAVCARTGAKSFEKPKELLKAGLDFVLIEGTNTQCAGFALEAVKAKVPMLIEKPGGPDLDALRKVAEAAEKARVFCQVGYHLRYAPSVLRARELVDQGYLGRITTARFHCAVPAPALTSPWFGDRADRGGLVYLDFCHMLDLLTLLLGMPAEALVRFQKLEGVPEHPFEDAAAFVFRFGDVLAAGDCCGWEAEEGMRSWSIELYGTQGTLRVGIHPPALDLYLRQGRAPYPAGWTRSFDPGYDGHETYAAELREARRRSVAGQTPAGADVQHALRLVEILDALYRSQGR
jgi:predicted dehydrogenase